MKFLDDLKAKLTPKTPAERERLKRLAVYTLLTLSCLVCLWLIFAPSGEKETVKGKANTELPDGTTDGDFKRSEYNTDDECKECPPPVFGARGAALEVDIIVEHFADCFLEAHSAANRGRCLYHIQEFLNDYD